MLLRNIVLPKGKGTQVANRGQFSLVEEASRRYTEVKQEADGRYFPASRRDIADAHINQAAGWSTRWAGNKIVFVAGKKG